MNMNEPLATSLARHKAPKRRGAQLDEAHVGHIRAARLAPSATAISGRGGRGGRG